MDTDSLFDELSIIPEIWSPKNWEDFISQALSLIEEGDLDSLESLADEFIRLGVNQVSSNCRKELLEFIYKSDFKKLPLEEQKARIKKAHETAPHYLPKSVRAEIAEQKAGEQRTLETAAKEIQPKTRQERRLGKYMSNTLSPASYNYLKLKHKNGESLIKFERREVKEGEEQEVTFEVKHLSDRCETVLDFLFDRLAKRNGAELLKKRPEEADLIPFEEFEAALERSETQRNILRSVSFTSMELRKQLEIRITDREIRRAVQELIDTKIELEGVKVWHEKNGDEKRYRKVTLIDRIAYNAAIQETGWVEPRTKAIQHKFTVTLGSGWDMILHNDILNKRFGCFPREFYKVSKGARAIGRYISCWKQGTFTIEQASEIAGYGETTNIRKRKKDIEVKLNELKRIAIVKSWKRAKKNGKVKTGKHTAWDFKRF